MSGYCCEEHWPSMAMTPTEQRQHECPVCSQSPVADLRRHLGGFDRSELIDRIIMLTLELEADDA